MTTGPASSTLVRFDLTERIVHWLTAVLMLELLATGAMLYIPALSIRVGHRSLVENIHVYSGLALLVPLLVGVAGPWRKHLLEDLRRFDRWTSADWAWFRRGRRALSAKSIGKFNGGQKAEATLLGSGMVVMLATGVLMRFAPSNWITWQQGATLVHDVGFIAIALAVIGHLSFALGRPEQLRSMVTGRIPRSWAERHSPAWLDGSDLTNDAGALPGALRTAGTPRPAQDRAPAAQPPQPSARRGVEAAAGTRPGSGSA